MIVTHQLIDVHGGDYYCESETDCDAPAVWEIRTDEEGLVGYEFYCDEHLPAKYRGEVAL